MMLVWIRHMHSLQPDLPLLPLGDQLITALESTFTASGPVVPLYSVLPICSLSELSSVSNASLWTYPAVVVVSVHVWLLL